MQIRETGIGSRIFIEVYPADPLDMRHFFILLGAFFIYDMVSRQGLKPNETNH
ncbi:MAG: hypothetical protein K0Q50_3123, partial [Vampirovibrio sp.]|nr:hypothetical protein [Vampirovibrio sp.]